MLKILRVGIVGDDMLDVQLNNGNILMLELAALLDRPAFAYLKADDRILYPKTDGSSVFWPDGPVLTMENMTKLLWSDTTTAKVDPQMPE